MLKKSYILLFSLIFIVSCGQDVTSNMLTTGSSSSAASSNNCSCSNQVDPVCATANGQYITYRNGCLAQCAGLRYTTGQCSMDDCDSDSGPVCGVIDEDLSPRVYSNECSLLKAGADQVVDSECNL
ncbi:MAG: hypothetical protein CME63_18155 [Halobacteriovoraceae bacterium]|nr:hypothetical protein [Halobacteriovoraceae bacterium]MBC99673.1 hypothetical protein [Halobacteriovoraceae bacterium]|tara:strand:+ start:1584 stop:1961 length:378 start_codon:yes stop_codon:yes gene_type:complete